MNVHAPTEDKIDDIKDRLYEELEHVFDKFPKYPMKILLGDFNAKVGREDIFKPTIVNESLHEISNDNGVRVVNFATSENLTVKRSHQKKEVAGDTLSKIVKESSKLSCLIITKTVVTVTGWVKLFCEGRDAIQDSHRLGRPHVDNHTIQLLASLLDADRRWAAWELAAEVAVCHKTVLHILHDILGYRKIAACWVPHTMSEVQHWQCYAIAEDLLDQYHKEGDDFLGRIVTLDETGARS
ncbi:hypothetical protein B7P43_G16450 [Cryptotermes secundus]|uniref:Endonuclease/exonuclease/phosphatase domain-containing protein n=1 Tax=Cryptotermes secundus TaxID=105785 RepID=A0A2J7QCY0_9NEOP|nr:hypothetical protein B7P43_G16450 [Cryptotermes secundus]